MLPVCPEGPTVRVGTVPPTAAREGVVHRGRGAEGLRADFTVFSEDIMTIPEEDILTVEPVMTIVDGEVVYSAR